MDIFKGWVVIMLFFILCGVLSIDRGITEILNLLGGK